MSLTLRLGLFGIALVAAFGSAFALGRALDPDRDADATSHAASAGQADDEAHGAGDRTHGRAHAEAGGAAATGAVPARILVEDRAFEPGVSQALTFRVVDWRGRTVRDFDVAHERAMHVIAVRHDLTGYRHVHPRQLPDGAWTVDVAFSEPGPHRVYADFVAGGEAKTLAADVTVAGRYAPRPLPSPATRAAAGDGYAVALRASGDERRFVVTRDGEPVDDVEPYLGARGHLVALRERDLRFQHVHPKDDATAGREIAFDVALAGAGSHRLFLQFKHDGRVRTAAFTERAARAAGGGHEHGEPGHGH